MSVIRHNTDTGNMALYADRKAAGTDYPVYASEADILKGKATVGELARFYNTIAEKPVNKFSDKAAAARRVWAIIQGQPQEVPVANQVVEEEKPQPEEKYVPVTTNVAAKLIAEATVTNEAAKAKRGRAAGTGEFAGKTVFAKKDVNPRRIGTAGFKSFEIIRGKKDGVPYADYIAAGGRPNDLRWDIEHKWAEVK